jgi:hypothetical protein
MRDADGHQAWCDERFAAALDEHRADPLFVSGCAENQVKFYPRFSHIVLMSAPAAVITERLARRRSNDYGKRPEELADVLHHLESIEPLLRRAATHEIVTTVPIDRVIAAILAFAQVPHPSVDARA